MKKETRFKLLAMTWLICLFLSPFATDLRLMAVLLVTAFIARHIGMKMEV